MPDVGETLRPFRDIQWFSTGAIGRTALSIVIREAECSRSELSFHNETSGSP
jgi:hypothetical protein